MTSTLIGCCFSFLLFGANCIQFLHTFRLLFHPNQRNQPFRTTPGSINFWVIVLLLATDFADSVCKTILIVDLVRNSALFGLLGLTNTPSVGSSVSVLDGFTALIVQLVMIRRIERVTRPTKGVRSVLMRMILVIGVLASFTQLGGAIWVAVLTPRPPSEWQTFLPPAICTWLITSAGTDAGLCLAFVTHLKHQRSQYDHRTNDVIDRWIRYSLETGGVTTLVQALTAILFLVWRDKPYYLASGWILGKVYICSVLVLFQTILSNTITLSHALPNKHRYPPSSIFRPSASASRSSGSRPSAASSTYSPPASAAYTAAAGRPTIRFAPSVDVIHSHVSTARSGEFELASSIHVDKDIRVAAERFTTKEEHLKEGHRREDLKVL